MSMKADRKSTLPAPQRLIFFLVKRLGKEQPRETESSKT
jgi:hypothetical protein